jgi:hypothetical protein
MSTDSPDKAKLKQLRKLIFDWLQLRLDEEAIAWVENRRDQLLDDAEDWLFFSSFSAAPRYSGKKPLNLSSEELKQARELRPNWTLSHWSLDQLLRTYLVLCIAEKDTEIFLDRLDKTFVSSDISEAVALYQSLPLLPYPRELTDRAAEGIRSNMTSVFNAVALRNPFPADYMDEPAWNQVVLKALFVESPLYLIQGIDRRANKKLAYMLSDYAHERWAAGREVSPELWRPAGSFAEGKIMEDLKKVLNHSNKIQQQAAVLALSESDAPEAERLIEEHQKIADTIEKEKISWDDIGRKANDGNI